MFQILFLTFFYFSLLYFMEFVFFSFECLKMFEILFLTFFLSFCIFDFLKIFETIFFKFFVCLITWKSKHSSSE